jgi:two-component system CheB/CheR fusion protein
MAIAHLRPEDTTSMPLSDLSEQNEINDRLRLLVDQAVEHAVLLIDANGMISWCNAGALRLFNTQRESLVGAPLSQIFTDADRQIGNDQFEIEVAKLSTVSEDDRWHVRPDGSRFWSSGVMIGLRDEQGNLLSYGKILRDRTDAKEQFELLSNSLESLRASNESKDLAITKISHELRNVFAGINMGLQLIESRGGGAVEKDIAELMHQQLETVQRLTEDLLDAKRLFTSKVTLSLSELSVQQVVHDVVQQLRGRCQEKSLQVHVLQPPGPVVILGDRVRLQQVFSNLIDNAIKYTPEGGNIWIKATTEDTHAVVHVEDNGKGIPPQMLSRIFDMFTQVDPNMSNQGLGLGLALVHELVHLHGGSIQATSKGLGMGSKFSVRLPLA